MGGSGSFQDMFLKAESTEFADELDVLYRTKRRVKDMDFPLLLDAISPPALDSVCYSLDIP